MTKEKVLDFSPTVPFFVRVRVIDNHDGSVIELVQTASAFEDRVWRRLSENDLPVKKTGHIIY
jgi:hypothetical protein